MELYNILSQMTHDYHCLQAVVLCDRKCCSDSRIAHRRDLIVSHTILDSWRMDKAKCDTRLDVTKES